MEQTLLGCLTNSNILPLTKLLIFSCGCARNVVCLEAFHRSMKQKFKITPDVHENKRAYPNDNDLLMGRLVLLT